MADSATSEATSAPAPRKRKRIFMWTFLVVQLIFIGLIVLYATEQTGPSASDVTGLCGNGAWQGLFKSYHDCAVHGGAGLNAAGHVGQGIGIALVIGLWVAADIILGVGRLVVVFSRRRSA